MTMDIEEKVKKAKQGNDNAFYELMQQRKDNIYRTAFIYVKNKDDALDIVNETMYKAYISIKKLREPKFFNTWLTRILINCAIDHINRSKKVIPLNEDLNIEAEPKNRSTEDIMDLYNAVDRLDVKCRTVVI
jgi:RNA polymerase sigma-70 factor (ECF subfamily)